MPRLIFKQIKKGMVFKSSGHPTCRKPDERIFRVSKKQIKPKKILMTCSTNFTKKEYEANNHFGWIELDFTVEQVNRLLKSLPKDTVGWFIE